MSKPVTKPPVIQDLALRRAFLELTENGYSPSRARKKLDISPALLTLWMRDPDFSLEYKAAYEAGTDRLEDEAYRRAHDGVETPVYQKGEEVGKVTVYSDNLMRDLLRARRPEKFRDAPVINNNNLVMPNEVDTLELAKAISLLLEENRMEA